MPATYHADGVDHSYCYRGFILWFNFRSMEAELDVIVVHLINFEGDKRSILYRVIVSGVICDSTICYAVNKGK